MNNELHWQHVVIEGLFVMLPILFAQWLSHRAGKKDADKREQKREFIAQEYPHHAHSEWKDENSEGPLRAENIRYPKANGR